MRTTPFPATVATGRIAAGYIAATGSAWGASRAGAAIGNFIATFINDAFVGEEGA